VAYSGGIIIMAHEENLEMYYLEDIDAELMTATLEQTIEENNSEQLAYALMTGFSIASVLTSLALDLNSSPFYQPMFICLSISGFCCTAALLSSIFMDEACHTLKKQFTYHPQLKNNVKNMFERIKILRNSPQHTVFLLGLIFILCALAFAVCSVLDENIPRILTYIVGALSIILSIFFMLHTHNKNKINYEFNFIDWSKGYEDLKRRPRDDD